MKIKEVFLEERARLSDTLAIMVEQELTEKYGRKPTVEEVEVYFESVLEEASNIFARLEREKEHGTTSIPDT